MTILTQQGIHTCLDIRYIQSASSDICSDEDVNQARLKSVHRLTSLILWLISMNASHWRGRNALNKSIEFFRSLSRVDKDQYLPMHF